MKRFELERGVKVEIVDLDTVYLEQDDDIIDLDGESARALCAALLECGFGPEEDEGMPSPILFDMCPNCLKHMRIDRPCPDCGKRIEVVR